MSTGSSIEWTDATWNPTVGCTPVSPGCLNCYAATMARRLEAMGREEYVGLTVRRGARHGDGTITPPRSLFNGVVRVLPDRLSVPMRWKKPRRVFVDSMSDLFHEAVPFEFIDRVFAVMALCPRHTFQVLTKRPERMAEYAADAGRLTMVAQEAARMGHGEASMRIRWPLANVWLGTSVENQACAGERVPPLLSCPAAVRFLSVEPLLGPVDLTRVPNTSPSMPGCPRGAPSRRVDWVIVGGESGPGARVCDVAWVRSVVRQCKGAGVPVFVKQLGSRVECRNDEVSDWLDEVGMGLDYVDTDRVGMQGDPVRVMLNDRKGVDMAEWPEDLRVREMPGVTR